MAHVCARISPEPDASAKTDETGLGSLEKKSKLKHQTQQCNLPPSSSAGTDETGLGSLDSSSVRSMVGGATAAVSSSSVRSMTVGSNIESETSEAADSEELPSVPSVVPSAVPSLPP